MTDAVFGCDSMPKRILYAMRTKNRAGFTCIRHEQASKAADYPRTAFHEIE
jgi:hypothetical protein